MDILDLIGNQLGGNTLKQMSQQLGADEATTARAVSVALPLLLGGLTRNAATPQGAASLDAALTRDHDGSLLDAPQRAFANPSALNAAGILGHIFGQRQAPVQQGVAKATGLDAQRAGQLLMMLAPLVMAALSKARSNPAVAGNTAGAVLQGAQPNLERQVPGIGGLASILDRDGDGQIADDIASLASSRLGGATSSGGLGGLLGSLFGEKR